MLPNELLYYTNPQTFGRADSFNASFSALLTLYYGNTGVKLPFKKRVWDLANFNSNNTDLCRLDFVRLTEIWRFWLTFGFRHFMFCQGLWTTYGIIDDWQFRSQEIIKEQLLKLKNQTSRFQWLKTLYSWKRYWNEFV